MASTKLFFLGFLYAAIIVGTLRAQTPVSPPAPEHSHPVPQAREFSASSPFAFESGSAAKFHIVPAAEISQSDKDLLARNEPELRRKASLMDLGFGEGNWTYVQLVCPSFPDHLLLRFVRNNGKGDVSMFSASILRVNGEKLRVIPIQRRGYAPFSPASGNPLTIAAFNRILAVERGHGKPDWEGVAMCYAALAGANPESHEVRLSNGTDSGLDLSSAPILTMTVKGDSIIRFVTTQPRTTEWEMVFDRHGKLTQAKGTVSRNIKVVNVPAGASNPKSTTIPAAVVPTPKQIPQ